MEDLSVVVLARNESASLPHLVKSLVGISDIVVLDTGSTDDTVKVARDLGCVVEEVGDKFRYEVTQEQIDKWVKIYGYKPSFKLGEKYFNYADARNYAASLAKNDWVFQADADEVVVWDLAKVREAIQHEDHLTYRFCFQHNADGTCGLEFEQSKMYRRSKLYWVKWIHEVLQPFTGQIPKPPLYCDFIYHHHWQNKTQSRGHYLPGLELSMLENPNDDRNCFYLAREYMWNDQLDNAIRIFRKAIELGKWLPEKSQAYIFMGNCFFWKGNNEAAIACYHNAMIQSDARRDAFFQLGELYEKQNDFRRALIYYQAAMAIPFQKQGYLNDMALYGWKIPDRMAVLHNKLGEEKEAKRWWLEAMKHNPPAQILDGVKWFYRDNLPLISIVVPVVRPEGYARLEKSIRENTKYPNYEIVPMKGDKMSAINKFNEGVEVSKGELVMFLADDTEVMPGCVEQAFVWFREHFRDKGLVVLNDEGWHDRIAHHFLASKNIRDELPDREIFWHGYHHCGADVELSERLKKKNLIEYCEYANLKHYHYHLATRGVKPNPLDEWYKLVDNLRPQDEKLLQERLKTI